MRNLFRLLTHLVRALSVVWLLVHFTLTVIYVLPLNPLKLEHSGMLNRTIGTYLPQNWGFFAPNPLSADQSLIARCLTADEDGKRGDSLPADGWVDLSAPFWQRHQQHRLAAYDRLIRPQSAALRQYRTGGYALEPWAEACQRGGWPEACETYDRALTRVRKTSGETLARVASAFCRDIERSEPFTVVALRMRERPVLAWSARYSGRRPAHDTDVGVYPVNRSVETTGLYRAPVMP